MKRLSGRPMHFFLLPVAVFGVATARRQEAAAGMGWPHAGEVEGPGCRVRASRRRLLHLQQDHHRSHPGGIRQGLGQGRDILGQEAQRRAARGDQEQDSAKSPKKPSPRCSARTVDRRSSRRPDRTCCGSPRPSSICGRTRSIPRSRAAIMSTRPARAAPCCTRSCATRRPASSSGAWSMRARPAIPATCAGPIPWRTRAEARAMVQTWARILRKRRCGRPG